VAEHHRVAGQQRGVPAHPVQDLLGRTSVCKIEPLQRQAGIGGVQVSVDEGGRDGAALHVDHRIGGRGIVPCAEPCDPVTVHEQCRRRRIGGCTDDSVSIQRSHGASLPRKRVSAKDDAPVGTNPANGDHLASCGRTAGCPVPPCWTSP
jgi:hypothetical protein